MRTTEEQTIRNRRAEAKKEKAYSNRAFNKGVGLCMINNKLFINPASNLKYLGGG